MIKLASRLALVLLFVLIAGLLPVPPTSYARQTAPDAPHLVYSSFFGGSRSEVLSDVAVAPDGSIVVLVVGAAPGAANVMRLSADGTRILGKRAIAGANPIAMAIGADGAIYVAGQTQGRLETVRPIQASPKGTFQGFAAKLSADASQLLFCTYLGGSRDGFADDIANDVAVDDDGLMYVVGTTRASNNDFPLANPTQPTYGGGNSDGFVSVIDPDAATLVFSTYLGDEGDDDVKSCAVDPRTQSVYVRSLSLPNASARGGIDCTVALERLFLFRQDADPGDEVPVFLIVLVVGACDDAAYNDSVVRFFLGPDQVGGLIDVHSDVNASGNAQQRLGGLDLRISVYDDKLKLLRTTMFGGPADEYPKRIAVDEARGIFYVIGEADGVGLPTVAAFQETYGGGSSDSFVAAFDLATLQPVFVSYIGGSDIDYPYGIALDADGNILLSGLTDSADFPATPNALQPRFGGGGDGWLAKVSALGDLVPDFGIAVDPPAITAVNGQSGTIAVAIARTGGFTGRVTVTAPDTKAIKVKLTPASASTSDESVAIKYKVKKKAQPGTYDLVFTGKDETGRERSASVSLTIQ